MRRRWRRWMRGHCRGTRRRSHCSTSTLALDSDGSWLRQALPPVAQRLRDAVETFAGALAAAGRLRRRCRDWLKLTGYASDAVETARTLRCRAVGTLTGGGETLAAAQIVAAVKPSGPDAPGAPAGGAGPAGGRRGDIRGSGHARHRATQLARGRQVALVLRHD